MKSLLFIVFSLFPFALFCQDFATEFIFRNAFGKTDTITVGYSNDATDSLDVSSGEINITDGQIDTNFCVYTSNVIAFEDGKFLKPDYRTKTQFLNAKLNALPICIDIICKDFPLTVKWDKFQFQDTSRSQSFIIPGPPGGWFDVGVGPFRLNASDSIEFSQQDMDGWANYYTDSIHEKGIKVWKMYIGFANAKADLGISASEDEKFNIYPNPCQNSLNILLASEKSIFYKVSDPSGKSLISKHCRGISANIDMSKLQKGIYFLGIYETNGNCMYKVIKN